MALRTENCEVPRPCYCLTGPPQGKPSHSPTLMFISNNLMLQGAQFTQNNITLNKTLQHNNELPNTLQNMEMSQKFFKKIDFINSCLHSRSRTYQNQLHILGYFVHRLNIPHTTNYIWHKELIQTHFFLYER